MFLRNNRVGPLFSPFLIAAFVLSPKVYAQKKKPRGVKAPRYDRTIRKQKIPQLPESHYRRQPKRSAKKVAPPRAIRNLPKLSQKESQFEKALDEEIKELHRLISKYKKSKVRGELWLRQAEHYREKAQIVSFRLQEKFREDFERWEKNGKRGKAPRPNTEASSAYYKKAIQLYLWFIQDFKGDPQTPLALYFLGFNYFEMGLPQQGKKALTQVLESYPQSEFGRLARFQMAEQLFEERLWRQAKSYYQATIQDQQNENQLFSLYKYAWCQYHLGESQAALENIKKVTLAASRKKTDSIRHQRIANEARKALVFFYAEMGLYRNAFSYFSDLSVSKKDSFETVADLASLYHERGDFEKSRFLLDRLLKKYPRIKQAPKLAYSLISQVDGWAHPDLYHHRLVSWVQKYSAQSPWAKANKKENIAESLKFQEEKMRAWCLHNHRLVQKKLRGASSKRTRQSYEVYLSHFSKFDRSTDVRFYYADLLFESGVYAKAASLYDRLVSEKTSKGNKKEVYLGRVLALEKLLPGDSEMQKRVGSSLDQQLPNENTKKFIKAATDFDREFPQSNESIEIKYRLGRIYYMHNIFGPAEEAFKQIIKAAPNKKVAEYSANLLLDIYNLRKDYDGLVSIGKTLTDNSVFKKSKIGEDIDGLVEQAAFKKIESKTQRGSSVDYLNFINAYPGSSLIPLAFFNAAVLEKKNKNFLKAIGYFKKSAATGKKDKKRKLQSHLALLSIYSDTGDYTRAAVEYEELAKLVGGKGQAHADYLKGAATLWSVVGEYIRSRKNWISLMQEYPRQKHFAMLQLAELNEDHKKFKEANEYYSILISETRDSVDKCRWSARIYENEKRQKRAAAVRSMARETLKCINGLSGRRAQEVAKEKAMVLFDNAVDVYRSIVKVDRKLSSPAREAVLANKLKMIAELEKSLQAVIKLNVSKYIVSSLAVISEAYRFIANFIVSSPVPEGIDGQQALQFRQSLRAAADKMGQNSKSSLELAKMKAEELEIVTDWLLIVSKNNSLFSKFAVELEVLSE